MGLTIMTTGSVFAAILTITVVTLDTSSKARMALSDEREQAAADVKATAQPLYRSSVVGTEIDFITDQDPSAFSHLEFAGFQEFEMPDKRKTGEPLIQNAYVFNAHFRDGTKVGIALDKDFGSREAAERDALRYAPRLGKLPALYRRNLKHVVVHLGGEDTTAFAEDNGRFFVIYNLNASKRIATRDLEETFFHEATHAAIQAQHVKGAAWRQAVESDNAYVTRYASSDEQEDFAESALFAYTLIYHPERIPATDRAAIQKQIPNRINFFRIIYGR